MREKESKKNGQPNNWSGTYQAMNHHSVQCFHLLIRIDPSQSNQPLLNQHPLFYSICYHQIDLDHFYTRLVHLSWQCQKICCKLHFHFHHIRQIYSFQLKFCFDCFFYRFMTTIITSTDSQNPSNPSHFHRQPVKFDLDSDQSLDVMVQHHQHQLVHSHR